MYKRPTDEQLELIRSKAIAWTKTPTAVMFADLKQTARLAVMEYIANGMGLTIYGEAFPELLEKEETPS